MRLSKNFTLAEFTKSQTALRKGLDNTPGPEHLNAARELFAKVVQPIRDKFGPTVINSGYRGKRLNKDLPFEFKLPLGIFHALSLYDSP